MRFWRLRRRRRRRLLFAAALVAAALSPSIAAAHDPDDQDRPGSDLAVRLVGSPPVVQAGNDVTFTLTIDNFGGRHAKRVRAAILLTGQIPITSAGGPGWSCDLSGSVADCSKRHLRAKGTTAIIITAVAPPGFARVGAGAAVRARGDDPDDDNNTATADVAINNPPVPVADAASTAFGQAVETDVLDNDFDPDGDALDVVEVSQGGSGTVTCDARTCTYTPAPGFFGVDRYTYTASDGRGGSATAGVTVTVAPPPPPPPEPPPPPPPPPPAPNPAPPAPDNSDNADAGVVVSGPASATVGGPPATYVFVVSNGCKVTARSVQARITLPAGATLLSAPWRAVRRGRIVTIPLGSLTLGMPRGIGIKLRFGPNGGDLRPLVIAITSPNSKRTGDGMVIAVRSAASRELSPRGRT